MSKSDAEKEALQSQGGVGTLAGGLSIPSDFMDRMTTTIRPEELSSIPSDIRDNYAGASVVEAVGKMPSMSDRFGPGGMTTLTGGNFVGSDFGNFGVGMGDMGNFDPTGGLDPAAPDFKEPKTFGQKAKDSIKGFLSKLARIHPATRNAAFALDFVKGLQNAENPQDFVKGVMGQLAMRKVGGNLGLSGLQKQGIGGLMNMAQGKQNLAQTVGGLANSAAFRKAAPSIFKSAYDKGGMNGVYLAATALGMGREAAGKGIYGALATPSGPPGDG
jgi:hypothetical protein